MPRPSNESHIDVNLLREHLQLIEEAAEILGCKKAVDFARIVLVEKARQVIAENAQFNSLRPQKKAANG